MDGRRLPASFALGEELAGSTYRWANNVLPMCLLVLLVVGVCALYRRRPWFTWVALPFAALFFWQNVLSHYDYGSYKILICSSWWIYPAISAGLFWLFDRLALPGAVRAVAVAALLCAVGWEKYEDRRLTPPLTTGERLKQWHDSLRHGRLADPARAGRSAGPLEAGPSEIRVRCLGTSELGLHNGDPRELMLAIKGPAVNQPLVPAR